MKRIIAILLSIMIVFGSYISTEAVNTNVTDTESELNNKTTISLTKSSATVYIGATIKIEASITNGKGKTVYSSSKKKVATVTSKGKIKAIGSGKAKITISNNGVKRTFKLTVKKPKLNHKKLSLRTAKTACYNKTAKLKVIGKTGKAKVTYKSNNSKVASVNKKGKVTAKSAGKAKITVKYRGVKFSCKVTVRKVSKIEKLIKVKKIVFKQLKKTLTKNVGTPAVPLNEFFEFSVETNGSELFQKGYDVQKIWAAEEKLTKNIEEPKYSLTTSGIVKGLSDGKIVPVKQGETTLQAKCNGKTLSLPITITKKAETTYKNKTAKVAYSYKDIYNILHSMFYDYIIKGDRPKYEYIACCFDCEYNDRKLSQVMDRYAYEEYDNGLNFSYFMNNGDDDTTIGFGFENIDWSHERTYKDYNNYNQVIEIFGLEKLDVYKAVYNQAQKLFKEANINSFKTDFEKLVVFSTILKRTDKGSLSGDWIPLNGRTVYSREYNVLINHRGACGDWDITTTYICTLLRIPCTIVTNEPLSDDVSCHGFNLIKLEDKWYFFDILNGYLALGEDNPDIKNIDMHFPYKYDKKAIKNYSSISKVDYVDNYEEFFDPRFADLSARIQRQVNGEWKEFEYVVEYTPEFFNKIFGWNGVEPIKNLRDLEEQPITNR